MADGEPCRICVSCAECQVGQDSSVGSCVTMGPRESLWKARKIKPRVFWRIQDMGDANLHGLLRKITSGCQPAWTEKCVAYNTADRTWRSEESLGVRHGDVVYSLPSWILVCDPTLPHFAPFPSF